MGLNKQTGNMYPFVTHTWNPIRGKCPHDCLYCYMGAFPQGELRFVIEELKTNLGEGKFIFIGSSTDMWVKQSQSDWIWGVLEHSGKHENRYLFQSKNPARFMDFKFPFNTILGTTIETNRDYPNISSAPKVSSRVLEIASYICPTMVSIEPIMDFDLPVLTSWINKIKPEFVSIGADSGGHHLPEPNSDKIQKLIIELEKITKVYIKDNLNRLLT